MSSILALLDIKHPILLAPMAGVSTPELAAEVSISTRHTGYGTKSGKIHFSIPIPTKSKHLKT